jgi:hypothetical protein
MWSNIFIGSGVWNFCSRDWDQANRERSATSHLWWLLSFTVGFVKCWPVGQEVDKATLDVHCQKPWSGHSFLGISSHLCNMEIIPAACCLCVTAGCKCDPHQSPPCGVIPTETILWTRQCGPSWWVANTIHAPKELTFHLTNILFLFLFSPNFSELPINHSSPINRNLKQTSLAM